MPTDAFDIPQRIPLLGQILAESGAAVTLTNTATETPLVSVVVPGGVLGLHGKLRLTVIGTITDTTAAADTFTARAKFGATTLGTIIQITGGTGGVASIGTNQPFKAVFEIANKGSVASQIGHLQIHSRTMRLALAGAISAMVDLRTGDDAGTGPAEGWASTRGTAAELSGSAKTLQFTGQWGPGASVNTTFVMEHYSLEFLPAST